MQKNKKAKPATTRQPLQPADDGSYVASCGPMCRLHYFDGKPETFKQEFKGQMADFVGGVPLPHVHHGPGCLLNAPDARLGPVYLQELREASGKLHGVAGYNINDITKIAEAIVKLDAVLGVLTTAPAPQWDDERMALTDDDIRTLTETYYDLSGMTELGWVKVIAQAQREKCRREMGL